MKCLRLSLRKALFLALLTLFLHQSSIAQVAMDMPDGEPIISLNTYSSPQDIRIVTTSNTIYSSSYVSGSGWTVNKKIYDLPVNRRFVDAAIRSSETGLVRGYAALLDNGDVLIWNFNGTTKSFDTEMQRIGAAADPQTLFQGGQTPTYKKILFDKSLIVLLGTQLYSNDLKGDAWKLDSVTIGTTFVSDVAVDNSSNFIAATGLGLFRRPSNSSYWTRVQGFDSTVSVNTVFAARKGSKIYAASNTAVYSSDNGGTSFVLDSSGIHQSPIIRFCDDASDNIYAVGYVNERSSTLFRRAPAGKRWTEFDEAFNTATETKLRVLDISADHSLEVATAAGCYSSTNQGDSWLYTTSGIKAENIFAMQMFSGEIRVVSTAVGIYRKQGTWSKVFPTSGYSGARTILRSNSPVVTISTQLAVNQNDPLAQPDIYSSTDLGATWHIDTVGLIDVPSNGPQNPSLFSLDRTGRKYLVINGAQGNPLSVYSSPWSADTTGLDFPSGTNGTQFATSIYSDASNNTYLSGGIFATFQFILQKMFLYKKAAGSTKWIADTNGLNGLPMTAFVGSKDNVYAGTSLGYDGIASIFRKEALQWKQIPSPYSAVSSVNAMCIDSLKTLYLSFGSTNFNNENERGVYATTNNGTAWDYAGLAGYTVRSLYASSDAVYAVTNHGVYELSTKPFKPAIAKFTLHDLDFGTVQLGTTKDSTFSIKNEGEDTLRLNFVRTNSQNFHITPYNFAVAPGKSEEMIAHFHPVQSGALSIRAQSVSNTLPDTINIRGIGRSADANIQLQSKFVIFGVVDIGTMKDSVIQVSNGGTEDLVISSIVSNNPVFSAQPSQLTVKPKSSEMVRLQFSPTSTANVNGVIKFIANTLPDSIRVLGVGQIVSVLAQDDSSALALSLNPNPVKNNESTLSMNLRYSDKLSIRVVDERGVECGSQFNSFVEAGPFEMLLSDLLPDMRNGVYFIHVKSGQLRATVKCIIEK